MANNTTPPTLETNDIPHKPHATPSLAEVLARPIVPMVMEHTTNDDDVEDVALYPNRAKEQKDDDPQRRLLERLQRTVSVENKTNELEPPSINLKLK